MKKYKIKHYEILGHSDIAPYRKIDPGKKFPWKTLNKNNLCNLYKILPTKINKKVSEYLYFKIKKKSKLNKSLYMLSRIGYNVKRALLSKKNYKLLIKSYQMHYMQKNVSGKLDSKTYNLIVSHFNEILT